MAKKDPAKKSSVMVKTNKRRSIIRKIIKEFNQRGQKISLKELVDQVKSNEDILRLKIPCQTSTISKDLEQIGYHLFKGKYIRLDTKLANQFIQLLGNVVKLEEFSYYVRSDSYEYDHVFSNDMEITEQCKQTAIYRILLFPTIGIEEIFIKCIQMSFGQIYNIGCICGNGVVEIVTDNEEAKDQLLQAFEVLKIETAYDMYIKFGEQKKQKAPLKTSKA